MRDKVGVIGLGYIGLPLLAALAESGYAVVGMDINRDKIVALQRGQGSGIREPGLDDALSKHAPHIEYTTDIENLMEWCDTVLVTVGTPLGDNAIPNINSIYHVTASLARNLRSGHLIILKSTVFPGLTRLVAAELEEVSRLRAGKDFFIAFHPERTLEGAAIAELHSLPKIIGGINTDSTDRAAAIIKKLGGDIIKVSSPEVAELCKLIDNTFRVANIGFANEVGDICQKFGVDPYEVREVVNSAYPRTQLFRPGLGADGPCLSKDPQILQYYANEMGINTRIIDACVIKGNESTMRIARAAARFVTREKIHNPKIAILGLAFKGSPETDDIRDAPAVKIQQALHNTLSGVRFNYFDPVIVEFSRTRVCDTIAECIKGAHVIMFLTDHAKLMNVPVDDLVAGSSRPLLILDCWRNVADPTRWKPANVFLSQFGSDI